MPANVWIGMAVGAVVGWIVSALFSKGPPTPWAAFRGDYEQGGVGCIGFLVIVGLGAGVGGVVGAMTAG